MAEVSNRTLTSPFAPESVPLEPHPKYRPHLPLSPIHHPFAAVVHPIIVQIQKFQRPPAENTSINRKPCGTGGLNLSDRILYSMLQN
jgi:hypothetical protein